MSFTHTYTVPSYYPNFHCKASDCRHPCCTGWDIAISMKEYFHMLSMACSPSLRRRLDIAFYPAEEPSEHRYAVISPKWDGDCPLRLENGYCGLQCECGESAIPSVCRYYPRSPKSKYAYQCQCSNSCEAVIEMLFDMPEPLTFLRKQLTFHMEEELPHEQDALSALFPAIQRACLRILQDRDHPLSFRLLHLGELSMVMDVPYHTGNADGLRAVLPYHAVADHNDSAHPPLPLDQRELHTVLRFLRALLCWISENNDSLQCEAKTALDLLMMQDHDEISTQTIDLWHTLSAELFELFPDNERMMEQILVNHLCYMSFPFTEEHASLWDSYIAFIVAFGLLRVLSVCHIKTYQQTEDKQDLSPAAAYADIVADVFRLVEHTNFAHNAPVLARRFCFDRPEQVFLLCRL